MRRVGCGCWFFIVLVAVAVLRGRWSAYTKEEAYTAAEAALRVDQRARAKVYLANLVDRDPDYRDAGHKLAEIIDASTALVPSGEFWMGSDAGDVDERPRRRVYLDAFEIDMYEVTNIQFQRFVLTTGHNPPQRWPRRYTAFVPEHDADWHGTDYPAGEALFPVVGVNWDDANAYCVWVGKRLPTEAEWEKAARGTDGRVYPWGDRWEPGRANSAQTAAGYTRPVGSHPEGASMYGPLDMAGNAWEWVADLYDRQYYTYASDHNPPGPPSGTGERILRGGAWDSPPDHLRTSYRNATHCFAPNLRAGFRCAKSIRG
jgi:formylglycine-generating enzyme required for sulfatase activity